MLIWVSQFRNQQIVPIFTFLIFCRENCELVIVQVILDLVSRLQFIILVAAQVLLVGQYWELIFGFIFILGCPIVWYCAAESFIRHDIFQIADNEINGYGIASTMRYNNISIFHGWLDKFIVRCLNKLIVLVQHIADISTSTTLISWFNVPLDSPC